MSPAKIAVSAKTIVTACVAAISCMAGPVALAGPASSSESALSAHWWQWALSIPAAENPILDASGDNCMIGQRGTVWFLAGNFSGAAPVTRNCTIPSDKTLFFPIANSVNIDTPGVCGQQGHITVSELRAASAAALAEATALSVTVDGRPVHNWERIQSPVFDVTLPEENVFDAPCAAAGLGNVPAGVYSPAVDDGYYLTIDRLEQGRHTLRLLVKKASGEVLQDVTYKLKIVPVSTH